MLRAVGVMWARQWLSSDDISNHKKCRKNFHYKFTSQTSFAAHASSRLFSGRVDQTRESGGNRAYKRSNCAIFQASLSWHSYIESSTLKRCLNFDPKNKIWQWQSSKHHVVPVIGHTVVLSVCALRSIGNNELYRYLEVDNFWNCQLNLWHSSTQKN